MQPAPRMLPQQTGNIMRMKKRYPVKTVYYINEQEDEFSSVVIEKTPVCRPICVAPRNHQTENVFGTV